jgi:hypothetical protein
MIAPSDFAGGGVGIRMSLPDVKRPLDSANHFGVAASGDQYGIMKMPVRWLARDEAINLAAWLAAIADPDGREFISVLRAIRGETGSTLTPEMHKLRHAQLHRSLDELLADWIRHTANLPSESTVMDFLKWSHAQTLNPS